MAIRQMTDASRRLLSALLPLSLSSRSASCRAFISTAIARWLSPSSVRVSASVRYVGPGLL